MYDIVLFDLDGTLTESGPGIVNSAIYALDHYGIEVKDRSELLKFVGPPLKDSFMNYYGFSSEKADEAVTVFRQYFRAKGMYENSPYPGIREVLEKLQGRGLTLAVATSKVEDMAVKILEHFDLLKYFKLVVGSGYDGSLGTKAAVVAETLRRCGVVPVSCSAATQTGSTACGRRAVMIGDRHHDIEGAIANGIDSIGVLYGYGSRGELEEAGATHIAETEADILKFLI